MARTRLYRNGVLEAEDFPVDDVSDHLEDPSAVVWVDLCDPDRDDLDGDRRGAAAAPRWRSRTRSQEHQRPKLDRYRSHLFLTGYAVDLDTGPASCAPARSRRSSPRRRWSPSARTTGFDIDAVVERWDASPDLAKLRRRLPAVRPARLHRRRPLRRRAGPRRRRSRGWRTCSSTTRPQDSDVQRRSFELRKSLVLLRRVVAADARGGERADAPRPARRRRGDGCRTTRTSTTTCCAPPSGPSRLRDLVTTILETNLTIQGNRLNVDHEEGDELGRDHRGAHRHHRLLRAERALPRLRRTVGLRRRRPCSSSCCRRSSTSSSAARTGSEPAGGARGSAS